MIAILITLMLSAVFNDGSDMLSAAIPLSPSAEIKVSMKVTKNHLRVFLIKTLCSEECLLKSVFTYNLWCIVSFIISLLVVVGSAKMLSGVCYPIWTKSRGLLSVVFC